MKHVIFSGLMIILVALSIKHGNFFKKSINDIDVIYIQPIGNVKKSDLNTVKSAVEEFYKVKCNITPTMEIKHHLYVDGTTDINAIKVINQIKSNKHTIIITNKNIIKNNVFKTYPVYGSAEKNGNVAIVSTYIMKQNFNGSNYINQLKKTSLHEIGHTLGMTHCNENRCIMCPSKNMDYPMQAKKLIICKYH